MTIGEGRRPDDWRTSMYYRYYEFPGPHSVRQHYGVRTERYKLMYFYNLDEWEMFDLRVDPGEMRSVHENPVYAPVLADMKTTLVRLKKHYKDEDQHAAKGEPRLRR